MRVYRGLLYALFMKTWISCAYGGKSKEQDHRFLTDNMHTSNENRYPSLSSFHQHSIDIFSYIQAYANKHDSLLPYSYPRISPIISEPQIGQLFIEMSCAFFTGENNTEYSCESTNFTQLQSNQCDIELNYTYNITNTANETVLLNRIIDESFQDLIDQSLIIDAGSKLYKRIEPTDICEEQIYTKQVVAIATSIDSDEELPFARDNIRFQTP